MTILEGTLGVLSVDLHISAKSVPLGVTPPAVVLTALGTLLVLAGLALSPISQMSTYIRGKQTNDT